MSGKSKLKDELKQTSLGVGAPDFLSGESKDQQQNLTPKNPHKWKEPIEVLHRKALKMDTDAQVRLAYAYLNSTLVRKDLEKARYWLDLALRQPDSPARFFSDGLFAHFNFLLYGAEGRSSQTQADTYEKDKTIKKQLVEDAFKHYQRAAQENYAPALFELGSELQKEQRTGTELLMRSAEDGYPPAIAVLASVHTHDKPKESTPTTGSWLESMVQLEATANNDTQPPHLRADAQARLGFSYFLRSNVKPDFKKAKEWLTKAATEHSATPPGMWAKGLLLEYEYLFSGQIWAERRPAIFAEAFNWYVKAGEQNYMPACFTLTCFHHPTKLEWEIRDEVELEFMEKLAIEFPLATYVIALEHLSMDSRFAKKNLYTGMQLMLDLAKRGLPCAQAYLGGYLPYHIICDSVVMEDSQRLHWAEEAIKAGDAGGHFAKALCYVKGMGVSKDSHAAIGLLKTAKIIGENTAVEKAADAILRKLNPSSSSPRAIELPLWRVKPSAEAKVPSTAKADEKESSVVQKPDELQQESKKISPRKEIVELVRKAESDDHDAQARLAYVYLTCEKDFKNAKKWLDRLLAQSTDTPTKLFAQGLVSHYRSELYGGKTVAGEMFEEAVIRDYMGPSANQEYIPALFVVGRHSIRKGEEIGEGFLLKAADFTPTKIELACQYQWVIRKPIYAAKWFEQVKQSEDWIVYAPNIMHFFLEKYNANDYAEAVVPLLKKAVSQGVIAHGFELVNDSSKHEAMAKFLVDELSSPKTDPVIAKEGRGVIQETKQSLSETPRALQSMIKAGIPYDCCWPLFSKVNVENKSELVLPMRRSIEINELELIALDEKQPINIRTDAQARLGFAYFLRPRFKKDLSRARHWLTLAAKQTDTDAGNWAQGLLVEYHPLFEGKPYETGGLHNCDPPKKAHHLYSKAPHYLPSQFTQFCYLDNDGFWNVRKGMDISAVKKLARQFPYAGYALSLYFLDLTRSRERQRNAVKGAKIMHHLAEQGFVCAQAYLAVGISCITNHGFGPIALDPIARMTWAKRAAAEGDPAGHYGLGCCYLEGIGTEVNIGAAIAHFGQAKELGDKEIIGLVDSQLEQIRLAAKPSRDGCLVC